MTRFIKLMALALTAVMLLTVLPITASAATETKTMKTGSTYSGRLNEDNPDVEYQITLTKSGTLSFDLDAKLNEFKVKLHDSGLNLIDPTKRDFTSGDWLWTRDYGWNSSSERTKVVIRYDNLKKGTYYLRMERGKVSKDYGTGDYSIKPVFQADEKPEITHITMELPKGSTFKLGAVVTPTGSKVSWDSSKENIATVSSKGLVTAKKKGTTVITARCEDSVIKLKVKVV